MTKRFRVLFSIEGIVQGVGFRPFVYTLAHRFTLKGSVLNDSQGVKIDIEGTHDQVELFEKALFLELPPLARIDVCHKEYLSSIGYLDFQIVHSQEGTQKSTLVMPDMSMCDDCWREMYDPLNKRHRYAFTNCTNCGPRYSIIKTVPYDRPNTSMDPFVMCPSCQAEYTNPLDRRYHAQPISCPECGPTLVLKTIEGKEVASHNHAIQMCAELIQQGHSIAFKGMGGFHLMCDATNTNALEKLREKKRRKTKPFALMFPTIEAIEEACFVTPSEKKGITSLLRPIVLVKRRETNPLGISQCVAPHIDRLGVFLPYTPLHTLLFSYLSSPIVATSANHSGEPIISDAISLHAKLNDVVSFYLDYNREIVNPSDDSVVQYIEEKPLWMRLSRGVTPLSFRVSSDHETPILAVGAHQKNAIALYLHQQIILSPFIGDLDTIASYELFERVIETFRAFYDFTPSCIVGDLHPFYASTQWAKKREIPFLQIQHHYAHILSGMCEHRLNETVLGIAWDGTGYGEDGTIWGGEFLVCDTHHFKRVASFEPFNLLGGEASIKEVRKVLASLLWDLEAKGYEVTPLLLNYFHEAELKNLKHLYLRKINAPLCSSVGRLFDAVAVVCGIENEVSYDGESGLFLESLYDNSIEEAYNFEIHQGVILYKEAFLQMIHERDNPKKVASKFINALANIVNEITKSYALKVVFSGGVFQNRTLVEKLLSFKNENFYFQETFPPNDGGICVGQIYYALHNRLD